LVVLRFEFFNWLMFFGFRGIDFNGGAKAVLPCRGLPLPQATNGAPRLLAAPAGSASGLASSVCCLRQNARYSPLHDSTALALLNIRAKSGKKTMMRSDIGHPPR